MKQLSSIIIVFIFTFIYTCAICQNKRSLFCKSANYFISSKVGIQVSGIRKNDFVVKNLTPTLNLSIGRWINPKIGLNIGYNGPYFKTIMDNYKHKYSFYYGELLLNASSFLRPDLYQYKLLLNTGLGYFINYSNTSIICMSLGISNLFSINNRVSITIDISSIIGERIYQDNLDILSNFTLGLVFNL